MNTNISKSKLSLWLSTFISIIGLLLIVLLAAIIEKTLDPSFNKSLLTLISVIIAIIPPILWMSVFYRQDRLNPEPKSYVVKTLLLGALVQKAIYAPIIGFVFPSGNSSIMASNYVTSIILVATIQEAIKLLSVRYSIYSSEEFDEKIDGIIYGSALGLGFAAMTSIDTILASGGAMLSNVTTLVVIETFAHASITGLSCYILGVSKQKKFNFFRLPLALIIASALNAIIQFLLDAVTRNGFEVNYIVGLIPVTIVAISVFTVLVVISSRNEKKGSTDKIEPLEPKKAFLGILPVWIVLALALFAGFFISQTSQSNTTTTVENIIQIQYPSNWIQLTGKKDLFKAGDMIGSGGQEFVSVNKLPFSSLMSVETNSSEEMLQNAAASLSIKSGLIYRFYQAEKGYFLNTKGKEIYIIDYLYIGNNQSNSGSTLKPSIGYGRDVLSIIGDELYIITISSSYEDYVLNQEVLNEIKYTFVSN